MTDQTERDAFEALQCLFLEASEPVARDVLKKVKAAFAVKDAENERLRAACVLARTALSTLIASGDRVVFSDALRALDEALATSAQPLGTHGTAPPLPAV
jgi:hypothetical protein